MHLQPGPDAPFALQAAAAGLLALLLFWLIRVRLSRSARPRPAAA